MVALSGELVVVLAGLAVLAGYYLRRQEEPSTDDDGCRTHLYGPVRLLHTETEHKSDGGMDVFDIVQGRCRRCGKGTSMTYNVRHIGDPAEDWSETADPVVYDEKGRATPPSTGVRE